MGGWGREKIEEFFSPLLSSEWSRGGWGGLPRGGRKGGEHVEALPSSIPHSSFSGALGIAEQSKKQACEKEESRNTNTQVRLQRAKELMPSLDLCLREATIRPEALAGGSWPSDYTLSDHGMVTCCYELRTL